MYKPKGLAMHYTNKLLKFLQEEQPSNKFDLQRSLSRFCLQEGLRGPTVRKYYTYLVESKQFKDVES